MKTIGQIIESARVKKKLSFKKLEDETKIRASFIRLIEKERWNALPAFPTVLGFVKSLSAALGIDQNMATAVLRRDYPPKKLNINPKPDVPSRLIWSPKLTFVIGICLIVLIVLGYLGFQYLRFISQPGLNIESPKEGQVVNGDSISVFGSTDLDVKITVNNQPVLVDADGKFSVDLSVTGVTKEVDIIATSRSGKMREIRRTIKVE